jgi:hypothetical protein
LSYLNEDEADAFFHEGDTGTYDGGPALSLAPVGMADLLDESDDHAARSPSIEQLARRERLKRLVTTVVGTLAAGSALVFAFRITRTESDVASAASLTADDTRAAARPTAIAEEYRAARAAAAAARETQAPAAQEARETAPPAAPALEAQAAPPVPAPAEHLDAEPTKALPPSLPVAHAVVPSAAKRSSAQTAERAPVREAHLSVARSSLVTGARSPTTSGHAPPTATFPD